MTLASSLSVGQRLPEYRVVARNGAIASDNKIHDDVVARQYGFAGGLVPGVTDYAYMTRPLVEAFGLEWLERGQMSARFLKPIYEGDDVTVVATVTAATANGVELEVTASNSAGEPCGVGTAALPREAPPLPEPSSYPSAGTITGRPPASAESLAVGNVLPEIDMVFGEDEAFGRYVAEVGEDYSLYQGPDGFAPSGYLIREANRVLHENVVLGPWIHVSSDVQHFSPVRPGTHLTTRAIVTGLFERKGHQFVDLDVLMLADGSRPVMRVAHRAIWDVRRADSPAD